MPKRNATAPVWVPLTPAEHADWLAGELFLDENNVRETEHGVEQLTGGTPLPCGCIPHDTRPGGMGVYCETEDNAYCNFECPHFATIKATLHHGDTLERTWHYCDTETVTPADVVAALAATVYGTSLTADDPRAAQIADDLMADRPTGHGWVHLELVER